MIVRNEITEPSIGAAIEVHRILGPGLIESVYEHCMCRELALRGLDFVRQMPLPVAYKGERVNCDLRLDIVSPGQQIVQLKAVEKMVPIFDAQLLTYMKLTGIPIGLLINFNVVMLKDGIKRLVL